MTLEELDVALEELETRLERLRALYEQYFLGFEKIEPAVARKDVDRRIYVLRREKIRNTGKRFKLQTIIQRYNTFQQYWQRICREIENGTYKRHMLRAERLMAPEMQLTIAAKRRFGKLAAAGDARSEAPAAEARTETPSSDAPATFSASEAPTEVLRRQSDSPESEDFATGRPPPQARASDQVLKRGPPPKPERPRPRPLSSPPLPRAEGSPKLESLELDMGFLGSWAPPPPKAAPIPKSSPKAAPPPQPANAPTPPSRPKSSPKAAPPPRPAAPPPKPAARPAEAPRAGLSDERVKALHEKLSALKKENREASQVSLESLKRTLHDAESKLREKHQGRKIDFEVVIRDGKAIVKPTVR